LNQNNAGPKINLKKKKKHKSENTKEKRIYRLFLVRKRLAERAGSAGQLSGPA
jgi:hypothetical protein